mgnify:CR=1 FL=1
MKTKRNVPTDTQRNANTEYLVTSGLGYCCLWKFLSLYHDNELIAARLGVSVRTIRRYRARMTAGEFTCINAANCLRR